LQPFTIDKLPKVTEKGADSGEDTVSKEDAVDDESKEEEEKKGVEEPERGSAFEAMFGIRQKKSNVCCKCKLVSTTDDTVSQFFRCIFCAWTSSS